MSSKAIGVFDSGVGGLTVLKSLVHRWPGENFVYLADTARLPYGSKSMSTIHNYCEQNVRFLMDYGLKAVVIACNTASTSVLERPLECEVPVFNVVEPGSRKAVEVSVNKRIGVLGTRATVYSEAYPHTILKYSSDVQVFQQACPLWVPLVEEGWVDDPVTNLIVYRYISTLLPKQVDTLILGCTHYPALRASITRAAGNSIQLVDSSMGLVEDLEKLEMIESGKGRVRILCTDYSPRFEETVRLLLGDIEFGVVETVDLKFS